MKITEENRQRLFRYYAGILRAAIARCHNPKNAAYKDYGARGISVCAEWRQPGKLGVFAFIAYIDERPSWKHSIDRINNKGNYEPGNVRWATTKEQQRNTRRNVFITHKDETLCLSEWAERRRISVNCLAARLKKMPFEEALNKPACQKKKIQLFNYTDIPKITGHRL